MIRADETLFLLETAHTAYAFRIDGGVPEHLYYGARLPRREDYALLGPSVRHEIGGGAVLDTGVCLENRLLEVGTPGWGDLRDSAVEAVFADGSRAARFALESWEVTPRQTPAGPRSCFSTTPTIQSEPLPTGHSSRG